MFKRIFFLILLIASNIPAHSETEQLDFKVVNLQKKEVNPGDNINVMLELSNQSDEEKTVQINLRFDNPNLRFIGDYTAIKLEKKSSIKKVVGIKIPGNLSAGNILIPLSCTTKNTKLEIGKAEIPVFVKSKFDFSLTKLKSSAYVLSGEDIKMSYQLQNLSNLAVKIKTTLINGTDNQVEIVDLPKDSSLILNKSVKTEKKVQGYATRSLIFIAQLVDMPESETSIYTPVDVFPSEYIKFDKYERFPLNISTVLAASNRAGKLIYSGMYDIQSTGTLGKNSDRTLEFHLRGPDRTGNPLFGMNDEYYLKYKSTVFSTNIGDYSFGLSELTESSRSGKGIVLNVNLNKFSLGGYYNIPRYYPLIKNVYAASAGFQLNSRNRLSVGFLSKIDTLNKTNVLYSISGKITPFSWISSDNEFAFGQSGINNNKAFKTSVQINFPKVTSQIVYLYSDPEFEGFVKNSFRLNAGTSVQLNKVTMSVNYDMNRTNMALDTLFANMPISKNVNVNASYRITPQNTLNLSYNDISLKDISVRHLFDYTRRSGRIILQNRLKSLNISVLGDIGKMSNRLDTLGIDNTLAYNGTLAAYYLYKNNFTASFFTSYQGGAEKDVSGSSQFYYGGGFSANLNEKLTASLQYTSNYEWKYYTSDRSLLSMNITARINAKNELNFMANYNLMRNSLDQKEYNVQLRYLYKLNMPIGKKKDLGGISGKIINNGIPKVEDIRLNLNGIVTMTDKEGAFRFPVVPVGNHILIVDASSLGINTMVEKPGPLQIKVEPGKIVQYDVPMTTTGQISGRIVIQEDERSNQKGFIPVKENIEKLIVEVSNGSQVFRAYTDKNGGFAFEDLLPGKWQVKIYPNGLPQGYSLVTSIYNIDLTYGKHEFIEVKIQKKARQIQFQKM